MFDETNYTKVSQTTEDDEMDVVEGDCTDE